jgi:carbonic anhydrase
MTLLLLTWNRFKDHRKWLHLYRCYSRHYKSTDGFAQMCFECDLWFANESEWEHLDNPGDLLRCDPMIFRNAPIKPGLCPFCLGVRREKPSKRMFQFVLSPPKWHSHIEDHLKELKLDFDCKHPACSTTFRSLEELTYHLVDTHCWRPRWQSPKKRKWADIKIWGTQISHPGSLPLTHNSCQVVII